MRLHALTYWILIPACSYEFGGGEDLSTTATAGGASAGTGGAAATTTVTSSRAASGATASTTVASTNSVASVDASSTSGGLPDPIPPCGGVADDFEAGIDPGRWQSTGLVEPHEGHVHLKVNQDSPLARIELVATPVAPCVLSFYRHNDEDVSITVRAMDESASLGLSFHDFENETWIRRNFQDVTLALDGSSEADAFAIVILDEQIVLLARIREATVWTHLATEPKPGWVGMGRAAIFNQTPWKTANVDDYGVIPVAVADLEL